MPELPEVETFRRLLTYGSVDIPSILGKEIEGGNLLWERTLAYPDPETFFASLPGQAVEEIDRRGKHLLLHLTRHTLIFHFRMSGEILIQSRQQPAGEHARLILNFNDGTRLVFNNPRKFGRVWLTEQPEMFLSHLGPEPLADDFTPQDLYHILRSHSRQIKYLLLDQRMIAGLGNIYTDEALFLSQIHPRAKSDQLQPHQVETLWKNIRSVLQTGIENQGTSIDWVYQGGDYQHLLNVYQRTDHPCPRCGTPIQRIEVAQRGTHICPHCQSEPGERSEP